MCYAGGTKLKEYTTRIFSFDAQFQLSLFNWHSFRYADRSKNNDPGPGLRHWNHLDNYRFVKSGYPPGKAYSLMPTPLLQIKNNHGGHLYLELKHWALSGLTSPGLGYCYRLF